jgi:hypothetical protein
VKPELMLDPVPHDGGEKIVYNFVLDSVQA